MENLKNQCFDWLLPNEENDSFINYTLNYLPPYCLVEEY